MRFSRTGFAPPVRYLFESAVSSLAESDTIMNSSAVKKTLRPLSKGITGSRPLAAMVYSSRMPTEHQNNAPATDAALMEKIGQGDQAAFTVLVDRHAARALSFVMRHLRDKGIGEDIVQDGFLKVWQHADRWEPQAQFTTWFYKLLYHACVDHWRKNRHPMDPIDDMNETLPDRAPHPEATLIRTQQTQQLGDALRHLPETQRTALLLFHQQELSQNDIAGIMNISVGAVESLLFRARRTLKTLLQPDEAPRSSLQSTSRGSR